MSPYEGKPLPNPPHQTTPHPLVLRASPLDAFSRISTLLVFSIRGSSLPVNSDVVVGGRPDPLEAPPTPNRLVRIRQLSVVLFRISQMKLGRWETLPVKRDALVAFI